MQIKYDKEILSRALSEYERYKGDKEFLNQRVKENELWYTAQYGRLVDPDKNETLPATAFIFSAVENKYADAVDNYPQANILEREPGDKDLSMILSKIIPCQLELSKFKQAYKTNWRRKLKHGTGIYGVFYDDDIIIKPLSMLNVYCDMHVADVQDSQFLFIRNAIDNEQLKKDYPQFKDYFVGSTSVENFDGDAEIRDTTEIVDCYFKRDGKLCCYKLCKNEVIDSSEDLYQHGKYPVVFDVLYPKEDCPFGYGIIDIAKNPQTYIDRLDSAIIKNALLSSKTRFLVKDNGSINENEFTNMDNDIIHIAGSVDTDSIRELKVSGIDQNVVNHRDRKITELKEIVGNRDFQQGGTNSGVTAASAISVLQEAGNKLSRCAIDDAYDCYENIVKLVIDLMREFYDDTRVYRITNDDGEADYAKFNKDMLSIPSQDDSEVPEELQGILPEGWKTREPIELDIQIVAQKQNPFQREANNTTIIQLWQAGLFNPQVIDMSVIALQSMTFDNRDKIIQLLRDYQNKQQEQAQQQQQQQAMMQSGQAMPIEEGIQRAVQEQQMPQESEGMPIEEGIQRAVQEQQDNSLPEGKLNYMNGGYENAEY